MKTKLTLLSCILLLLAGVVNARTSQAPEPLQWKRYTVKGEEFSVSLPALPAMVTNKTYSARLKMDRRIRLISTAVDGMNYTVEAYENSEAQQSLQDFIAEQAADSGHVVSSERNLTVNGFLGKEYSYRENNKPATEQFFATEERLYRFVATGATAEHPGVKQFFASIMLGKKTDGIAVFDGPGLPLQTDSGERVYTGGEVDKKVKLQSHPPPEYPDSSRSKQITGLVVLKAVFSSTGKVTDIRVVQGVPGLTEKAIEAAKKIKFIPAMKDGKLVSMWMQLEYNFNTF